MTVTPLLDVDQDSRWCNKWGSTIKDVSLWWVPPLSFPNKRNNPSRQDAGQDVLRSGRQGSDIKSGSRKVCPQQFSPRKGGRALAWGAQGVP